MKNSLNLMVAFTIVLGSTVAIGHAGPLEDRINAGGSIRIGFANEAPFAYPGEDGEPAGFINAHTIGVLKVMGYNDIEAVVTDWGGLIPGLQAGRFDIITGGMNITAARCENIAFSEPVALAGDGFLVPAGNPHGINNYEDIAALGAVLVTGAGYSNIQVAMAAGVDEAKIMQVPGMTEILASVRSGRADVGASTYFNMQQLANSTNGELEVTDPSTMPAETMNWAGIGFRPEDQSFVDAFNAAQRDYLGSPEMMASVAQYGYGEGALPGDVTTEWVCANR